jgi:glutamate-1-semialdehyde 2,1-aminomutase
MFKYNKSEALLARAEKVIPLGTQTFSKSRTQFPLGSSPYYISRGEGSHVWDVDDNEYIDFISSLNAITLGYSDSDVLTAVTEMAGVGSIFSLPHEIEIEVAEAIVDIVPCAEMVRFGKNGSDATAGAVRAARAFTGRDYIAICGYHGWQDWYIGSTTKHKGVPNSTRRLSLTFEYNNLQSLDKLFKDNPDKIAAVIMEPMHDVYPEAGFLESVKELAHNNSAVLIFDEMITGFRFANGGAQEFFGVLPDLATFGKGLANGYPISAVAGRADIMKEFEEIFFSFTFGGELISLAAAKATLDKYRKEPVIETLALTGGLIKDGLKRLISKHEASSFMDVSGHPSWSAIKINGYGNYDEWEIKTYFLQEMFARGILTYGSHNMNYAHSEADSENILAAYDQVLPLISSAIIENCLGDKLNCDPLRPLFGVRSP